MKVMEDTYSTSDRTIDLREIKDLKWGRTAIRDLKTAVNVLYNFDAISGRFLSETGISEDTNLQTRYNITQLQSLLTYEARHIHDSTTAGKIRTFLLNFLKQPHNLMSGRLGRNQLDLDLGDRLAFTNLPVNAYGEDVTASFNRNENGGSSQTIYPYFWIHHIERGTNLFFRAIQLHNLT